MALRFAAIALAAARDGGAVLAREHRHDRHFVDTDKSMNAF